MSIPAKAVEAAAQALDRHYGVTSYDPDCIREASEEMTAILEAAAPFIAAQALRDAADSYRTEWWGSKESLAIKSVRLGFSVALKTRADKMETP